MADNLLRLIDQTDAIINFYVKCPDGKRGRPMGVSRAVEMNKIDPGSVCAKETPNGRTVFYGTGNKTAGKQASKNVASRAKESYKARGMGKAEISAERKSNRESNRAAEKDYRERQRKDPDAIKEREVKRAKATLAKHGVSMESSKHQEELGQYKSQLMEAQKNIEALTKQLKEISGKLTNPSQQAGATKMPSPVASASGSAGNIAGGGTSTKGKTTEIPVTQVKQRVNSKKTTTEQIEYIADKINGAELTQDGIDKAKTHLEGLSTNDLQELAKELKLNVRGITGKERLKEVIIEDSLGFRVRSKAIQEGVTEEFKHRKYDDWRV